MESSEKPVDINSIHIDKDKMAENPGLLPFAHTVGSAVIKPEDTGKIKGRAVTAMRQQTELQLAQIYQQMQLLAEQANRIKQRVDISERIYTAAVGFEPLIGQTYYLYQRKDNTDVLSLVGPGEWGRSKPFQKYLARVTMLADHTWDVEYNPEEAS
ncbi:DUF2452 domain-containing protein [Cytophagaceae bacterium DM2B3-1]|uniref:DUF2452 domain-containing protein n=1 Tax=Xanthocytophaga flava TaxID=3048013 RepID=A0ABT7CGA6_9BACT|nr:DUF2452 domain-containing protein [Xanthocytophaga flavus]MDJ1471995.1 DUF2452 domain-containing protein [Xanthocytophaga flavus]MDJ1492779.1 DUF2452 domain-containing protein [Xanthocytophaga flavus]